ncbi:MAG: hypothetical protein PS018_01645, partial [bacterium]|nr:hypothetical protein [bacterium]
MFRTTHCITEPPAETNAGSSTSDRGNLRFSSIPVRPQPQAPSARQTDAPSDLPDAGNRFSGDGRCPSADRATSPQACRYPRRRDNFPTKGGAAASPATNARQRERHDGQNSTGTELDMLTASAELAGDRAVIARAEALRPVVAAASEEIETTRRLPAALLDRLHDAQLFRLLLPRATDGIETDPVTFFHVIETIAKEDASTAWCLSQAGGCAMSAAYLDLPVARAMFCDPRALLAWGPGPKVRAVACEGGYRVTGTWSFASGGRHATWLGAHCPIFAADGSPLRDA